MDEKKQTSATEMPKAKHADVSGSAPAVKSAKKKSHSTTCVVVSSIITALVVLIIGFASIYFVSGGALNGKTSLTESELDAPIASYFWNGIHPVTSRQVFEYLDELSQAKIEDSDNYYIPSSSDIIFYVQDMVCLAVAEDSGAEVSDGDMEVAALYYEGTNDYASIAEQHGLSEDSVKGDMREHALFLEFECNKLSEFDENAPAAPAAPENGDEQQATPEYAEYIKNLVGDSWDASAKTWKSDDQIYSGSFDKVPFDGENASFVQAELAYVLYMTNTVANDESVAPAWQQYMQELLARVIMLMPNVQ